MRAAEFAVDLFTLWVEEYSDEDEPDLTSCVCVYVAASCFDDDLSGILKYTLQKAKREVGRAVVNHSWHLKNGVPP